jgi:hypothetical protein
MNQKSFCQKCTINVFLGDININEWMKKLSNNEETHTHTHTQCDWLNEETL